MASLTERMDGQTAGCKTCRSLCACFAHDDDKQPPPVVLLDPILAHFSYDCENGAPSDVDCRFAVLVASTMSTPSADEELSMRKFWQLLGQEFKVTVQRAKYGEAESDGSFLHLGGLLVNIEVKNEIGSGGGATHVQNAAYAAAHAFQADKVRRISVCPTLLIELAGPNMNLSGAVFTTIATCDQLSPMISLLWQPHSKMMMQAAWCFAAIRTALPSLCSFYEALDQEVLNTRPPSGSLSSHTQQVSLGRKEVQCSCTTRTSCPVLASRQQWTKEKVLCW